MEIYLVRHGETNWNKVRKLQGQVDIPLNEFGKSLAVKTAEGLKDVSFDVCFTSPLERARETAELILNGADVPIINDDRIIEMGFGAYEGKCCSREEWELPESFHLFFTDPEHYVPAPDGESFLDVKERTRDFLRWLYACGEYENNTILITTHGAALAGLLNNIKNKPLKEYWGVGVHKNCAVTKIVVTKGVPELIFENKVYYDDEVKDW